jgi:DNA topoisomerase-3
MERHGIGTDATVADHIQKQLDRGYAVKDQAGLFSPTPLGEALVASYHRMGLSNLWQPNLRSGPHNSQALRVRIASSVLIR